MSQNVRMSPRFIASAISFTILVSMVVPVTLAEETEPAAPSADRAAPVPRSDAGPYSWVYGPYQYDPAGNVIAIGSDFFTYDPIGRLVGASINRPDQPTPLTLTYGYDVYGNQVSANGVSHSASASTNRLTSNYAVYDTAGNLTSWQPSGSAITRDYTYDSLNMLTKEVAGDRSVVNIYTADDERIWALETVPSGQNISHWTVRDLDGKVLRDFIDDGTDSDPDWSLFREYVYRGHGLLAVNHGTVTEHVSLDHLGTPRLITDGSRNKLFHHHYLPFGTEWIVAGEEGDGSTLRFTGHERDDDLQGMAAATLDYMHARYYSSTLGRFASVDPIMSVSSPQRFNRYSYVANTPLMMVDPDGRFGTLWGVVWGWYLDFAYANSMIITVEGRIPEAVDADSAFNDAQLIEQARDSSQAREKIPGLRSVDGPVKQYSKAQQRDCIRAANEKLMNALQAKGAWETFKRSQPSVPKTLFTWGASGLRTGSWSPASFALSYAANVVWEGGSLAVADLKQARIANSQYEAEIEACK